MTADQPKEAVPASVEIGQEMLAIEAAMEQFRIAYMNLQFGHGEEYLSKHLHDWLEEPLIIKLRDRREELRGQLIGLNLVLRHIEGSEPTA